MGAQANVVNLFTGTVSWFTDGKHWSGPDGVPHRVVEHLGIAGISVGLAILIALPVAVLLGRRRRGGNLVINIANGGRAIPTFGVLVLFAVGPFGIGNSAAIAALTLFAIPPILTNTFTGMRGVDADVKEAARGMGMTWRQLLRRVELPLAVPLIAAGIRTAAVQVVATTTLAAFVGTGGLGRFIIDGYSVQDLPKVLAGAIIVAMLALLTEVGLGVVQARLTPGERAAAVLPGSQAVPTPVGSSGAGSS